MRCVKVYISISSTGDLHWYDARKQYFLNGSANTFFSAFQLIFVVQTCIELKNIQEYGQDFRIRRAMEIR